MIFVNTIFFLNMWKYCYYKCIRSELKDIKERALIKHTETPNYNSLMGYLMNGESYGK